MGYVLLLALIAFGVPLGVSLGDRVEAEVRAQARDQAELVAASAPELLEHAQLAALRRLTRASAEDERGRVIVVDETGAVIADSSGAAAVGSDYGSRPEIQAALRGDSAQETRDSATLDTRILATAVPILEQGRPAGAVRVTQSVDAVDDAIRDAIVFLLLLGAVVLLLGVGAGALVARETSAPIGRLEAAARRVEAGDLDSTATVEGSSEQRSLARSFNRMTGRLARMIKGQQDFVADASHQLRTPLTGVRLQLEELREEAPEGSTRATELDASLGELDRLSQIVEELLILSRAGEHELPGEEVDLARAADRAVERWRKAAQESGLELSRRVDGRGGRVWCARADLDRALDSLIENAVRYSPPGGEVVVASAPGMVEVLDTGPGLEPGEEQAVFERFHRGSAARRGARGTGLGLPIARELAGRWGGSVTLANRPGAGARAVLALPLSSAAPTPAAVGGTR